MQLDHDHDPAAAAAADLAISQVGAHQAAHQFAAGYRREQLHRTEIESKLGVVHDALLGLREQVRLLAADLGVDIDQLIGERS